MAIFTELMVITFTDPSKLQSIGSREVADFLPCIVYIMPIMRNIVAVANCRNSDITDQLSVNPFCCKSIKFYPRTACSFNAFPTMPMQMIATTTAIKLGIAICSKDSTSPRSTRCIMAL